ncbi:immunity 49 family protein [Kitasatospora sp. NPDC051853]|uniref:immunity 49 family protein n=1 Tax=Kitasatospora sp. NPDC051853 TaxID=3364058 RepID=UPI00379ABBB9
MISRVARHGIPVGGAEDLAEVLGRGVSESLESVESSPQVLGGAFETAMTVARLRSLADPTANRLGTWEAHVLAMQVATAVFAAATADEDDTVECRIDGTLWDVPAIGAQEFTGPGAWLNAFWLGVVCQEPGRLSTLSRVPEEVLRGSGTEFDEYVYPWVAALQAFWNDGDELGDRLAEAVEGADPDRAEVAGAELMLKVLYPPTGGLLPCGSAGPGGLRLRAGRGSSALPAVLVRG